MSKPKLIIPLTNADKALEASALLGIIVIWAICIYNYNYNYNILPETIPRHFNAAGEPDAFGSRNSIWILPIITTGLYIGLTWIAKIPHSFNYPVKITPDNAAHQYKKAVQMIRGLKVIITIGLSYIAYESVQVALKETQKMGSFTLILFLLAIFGVICWYLFKTKTNKT